MLRVQADSLRLEASFSPLALAGATALLFQTARGSMAASHAAVLGLGVVGALLIYRKSVLVATHLVQVAIFLGLAGIVVNGVNSSSSANSLAIAWLLTVIGIAVLFRDKSDDEIGLAPNAPTIAQLTVGFALAAATGVLARSGTIGLAAQFATGSSTPVGLLSVPYTLGPLWATAVFVSAVVSGRRIQWATGLIAVQALALSLTGFRGAPLLFALSVLVTLLAALPKQHRLRSPRWILSLLGAAILGGAILFWPAAQRRSEMATVAGLESSGTQLIVPAQFLSHVFERMDLTPFLETAVAYVGVVPRSLAWAAQFQAALPRAIFPEKPAVTYGISVAEEFYGSDGVSASTLTWLGDIWVNGGALLTAGSAIVLTCGVLLFERRVGGLGANVALPTLAVVVSKLLRLESSTPLALVGAVRDILLFLPAWVLLMWLSTRGLSPTYRRAKSGPNSPKAAAPNAKASSGWPS